MSVPLLQRVSVADSQAGASRLETRRQSKREEAVRQPARYTAEVPEGGQVEQDKRGGKLSGDILYCFLPAGEAKRTGLTEDCDYPALGIDAASRDPGGGARAEDVADPDGYDRGGSEAEGDSGGSGMLSYSAGLTADDGETCEHAAHLSFLAYLTPSPFGAITYRWIVESRTDSFESGADERASASQPA